MDLFIGNMAKGLGLIDFALTLRFFLLLLLATLYGVQTFTAYPTLVYTLAGGIYYGPRSQ